VVEKSLREQGWEVLIIWECETHHANTKNLADRLHAFLANGPIASTSMQKRAL
jgi:G:T-mismatch repair DNA endonuclease (very short patch repair protein)